MTDPANELRRQALPTARDLLALAGRPIHAIAHPAWSEARETVLALVTAGPAMIVVLGPPGTGKTALLRELAATFGERGRSACLLDFGDSPFDIGPAEIVLVDEADRMSATRLDELRGRGDLAIILATLPASGERFALYPDITVVPLSPLSPDGARAFLVERLAQLGLPSGCLTEAAWTQLIACGRGVPRLLLISLGLALFLAGEEQAEQVTDAHVEQAVEAKGGGADASTVEPACAEPDLAQQAVEEIAARPEGQFAPAVLDWLSGPPPSRWGGWVAATAAVALYLVSAAGLLTWGVLRQMHNTAPPASDVSAVVRMNVPPPASAKTEQIAATVPPPTASPLMTNGAAQTIQDAAGPLAEPQAQAPAAAIGTMPNPLSGASRIFATTPQQTGAPASQQPGPALSEVVLSLPPDRSMARRNVSGADQSEPTNALALAQLSELDANIARRARPVARHGTPATAHQALRPVPYHEPPTMPPRMNLREAPSAQQQLLAARQALAEHKSPEARYLLEAAQTSIVFAPGNISSTRVTAQIADALSVLNSGDAASALMYLDRAITAIRPTF